jgi:HSP20 family protein
MSTTLAQWRPFGFTEPFRREMESLFDRFFGEEAGNGQAIQSWSPRMDVEETDKDIVVKADVPGVDPKAVEITVQDGVLTVRGEKEKRMEEKKKNFYRIERFAGSFSRQIVLPAGVDAEKVDATSANGVVTITIPKKPEAQPKRIPITQKS